jgi:hypothetical protein
VRSSRPPMCTISQCTHSPLCTSIDLENERETRQRLTGPLILSFADQYRPRDPGHHKIQHGVPLARLLRHGPAQDLHVDGQRLLPPIPTLTNLQGDGVRRRGQEKISCPPRECVNEMHVLTIGSLVCARSPYRKDDKKRAAERAEKPGCGSLWQNAMGRQGWWRDSSGRDGDVVEHRPWVWDLGAEIISEQKGVYFAKMEHRWKIAQSLKVFLLIIWP